MEAQSEQLYREVLSCLESDLQKYTDVEYTVRRGGSREVNRGTVFTAVVIVDDERVPEEDISAVGGAIQKTLSESGINSDDYVVSSVSQRPDLFDVQVGVGIHDQF